MKNCYFSLMFMASAVFASAQASVTFSVDMSNETVSGDGVHIAGGFQGWDPAATLLSDDDMDGIWEITLNLEVGTHEFKFINGAAWDYVEDVPSACQVEINGNDNRFVTISETDTDVSVNVCYASCAACGMTTVRMRVDMSVEAAISPNGVHVAGDFQGWNPAGTALSDANDDGVWEAFVSFDASAMENDYLTFKFINGNAWTNPNENIEDESCGDGFGNRVLPINGLNMILFGDSATGAAPCYNACGTCVAPTQVTFQVDMTTQETVSVNGVHIAGSFQGWNPSANALSDDDGDGIWETTLAIAPGDIQFKFINGNDWSGNGDGNVDNELIIGDCAAAGSDNRLLTVGSEDFVYAVCYNSCAAECVENPDPADVTFRVDMSEEEVNANGVWVIGNFTSPNWQAGALQLTDDDADGVYEVTANISGSASVLFKFVNGDPGAGDNGVDYVEESGIQLDENNEEVTNFELDGCGLPNGFGAYNRIHERSGEPEILDAVCFNKCSTCIVSVSELDRHIFNAFPNPFDDQLIVQLARQNATSLIQLIDLSGKVVGEWTVNPGLTNLTLQTSEFAPGSYLVQLSSQGLSQNRLFIKN